MSKTKFSIKCMIAALAGAILFTGMPVESRAATNFHSQADAVNWATSQIGKSLDYDGMYGAQCVDLIKYYYAYLGNASYAKGNANQYITNKLPSGWKRVTKNYQPGDIAVWKTNHSCGTCTTYAYGHVGIITSADSVGFNAVNQNFNKSSCTHNWFYVSALKCAIRPDFSSAKVSLTYSTVKAQKIKKNNAELFAYIKNPSKAKVTAVGAYVWDSNGKKVVNYKENCSVNYEVVQQTLNIVNEAHYKGLKSKKKYTFQLWAKAGGKTFYSKKVSFKTK